MIKSITVTNPSGKQLTMVLGDPWASGFVVMDIGGLGPPKADINLSRLATLDGGFYNSARVGPRNITLKLKYLEVPTIEHARRFSYEMFPLKKYVYLSIETDIRTYETYGYVESNEPEIFSSAETTVISIVCPNAYLNSGPANSLGYESVNFYSVIPEFEFPFQNLSLTQDLTVLGVFDASLSRVIDYPGDIETGFEIVIQYVGTGSDFNIYNVATAETMFFRHNPFYFKLGSTSLTTGDIVNISTVKGAKSITVTRAGTTYKVPGALSADSTWLTLRRGINNLAYSGTSASNMRVAIRYKPLFEGI